MSLSSVTITARFSNGVVETVYTGDPYGGGSFPYPYGFGFSNTTAVTGGFDWNIMRTGGWFGSSVEFTIDAVDGDGNHTIETITWILPVPGFAADVVTVRTIESSLKASDPAVVAPIGAIRPLSGFAGLLQKVGPADTDWQLLGEGVAQALGSVTIDDGSFLLASSHLILTSSQRIRLFGTGRLSVRT